MVVICNFSCKVKACPYVARHHGKLVCSRCQCDCDGEPVSEKLSRRKGQRKKRKRPIENKRRAAASARTALRQSVLELETEEYEETIISSPTELCKAFGLSYSKYKNLPSKKDRENESLSTDNPEAYARLKSVFKHVITACVSLFYPGNCSKLLVDVAYELSGRTNYGKKSYEERVGTKFMSLSTSLLKNPKIKRMSTERLTIRALFAKCIPDAKLKELRQMHSLDGLSKKGLSMSYKTYNTLEETGSVERKKIVRRNYDFESARELVSFILSEKVVKSLSWGTKVVKLDNVECVKLPRFVRKMPAQYLYDCYVEAQKGIESEDGSIYTIRHPVERASFYRVLSAITSEGERLLEAVDYVRGLLVYDPAEQLQRILEDFSPDKSTEIKLSKMVEIVTNFVKVQYKSHLLRNDDDVPTHGLKFALSNKPMNNRCGRCNACEYPEVVRLKILDMIEESARNTPTPSKFPPAQVRSAVEATNDAFDKFHLYLGHRARVMNQSNEINMIFQMLEDDCLRCKKSSKALVIADYKMKFEEMHSRELSTQHYGKRGISWHGFMLVYYDYVEVEETDEAGAPVFRSYADRKHVYMDQIVSRDNCQDTLAVVSLLETFLVQVKEQFPNITEIILQSDNASYYSSPELLVWISVVNSWMSGIAISQYIHSETQDGKGLLDAHFGRGTQQCISFMKNYTRNEIKAITSGAGLAYALAWGGGIQNSCVQLIEVDRVHLKEIHSHIKVLGIKLKTYFSRVNHVMFTQAQHLWNAEMSILENIKLLDFKFRVFRHSGIGKGVLFEVVPPASVRVVAEDGELESVNLSQTTTEASPETLNLDGSEDDAPVARNGDDFCFTNDIPEGSFTLDNVAQEEDTDGSDKNDEDINFGDDQDCEEGNCAIALDFSRYAQPESSNFENTVTKVKVLKHSLWCNILGARDRNRNSRVSSRLTTPDHNYTERVDLVATCVRLAGSLISDHKVNIRDGHQDMEEYLESRNFNFPDSFFVQAGWARRPPHGHAYGNSYLHEYKEDIRALFEAGRIDSSIRPNPGTILDALRKKYPHIYTLPSESRIKVEIANLNARQKKNEKEGASGKDRQTKKRIAQHYVKFIETLVEQGTQRKLVYDKVLSHFTENGQTPADLPSEKTVKAKYSTVKRQLKLKQQLGNM